jgi:hypothetical protein
MTRTLYEVMNEHATVKDGIWTFRESGHQYKNGMVPGTSNLILVPIIDDIERADQRVTGAPYDCYAAVLKREGIIS